MADKDPPKSESTQETPPEEPSYYPKTTQYESKPTDPSSKAANGEQKDEAEELPSDYEVLIEIFATVKEKSYPSPKKKPLPQIIASPITGVLRVVQGPLNTSLQPTGDKEEEAVYHAFISISDVNIPLLSSQPARRCGAEMSRKFALRIPERVFIIQLHPETEVGLVDGFERLLQWFCKWEDDQCTEETGPADSTGAVSVSTNHERFARAGDRGVEIVESIGGKINNSIQKRIAPRIDAAREVRETREAENGGARSLKLGVGTKVLSGTRTVLETGANLASSVADKISDAIGVGIGRNPVTKTLSEAPEGSKRKGLYNNLMTGMLAFGRVYVAADHQGKLIIESTGRSAAAYAGVKYGDEAEAAARNMAHIAMDGYRIFRFPEKLGATSLVKGAFTSTAEENLEARKKEAKLGASTGNLEVPSSVSGEAATPAPQSGAAPSPQSGAAPPPKTSEATAEFKETKD